jgi:hypothetical protein
MNLRKAFATLALTAVVFAAFADDAQTLPTGVFRLSIIPTFATATKAYDAGGSLNDSEHLWANNLGLALEYGVTDWISGAVQWVPGWTYASYAAGTGIPGGANINGINDLFIGAKIQIVGEKAPVQSDTMRFCVAPGVKIPMGQIDYADEFKDAINPLNTDSVTAQNNDRHVFGFGPRFYFDYIVNKDFYVNLYSELLDYPVKGNYDDMSLSAYQAAYIAKAYHVSAPSKVDYGYDLTFEVEPTYSHQVASWVALGGSLPITWKYSPAIKADGDKLPGTETSHLTLNPTISAFVTAGIPTMFKVGYLVPVAGTNYTALSALNFQIRSFIKFW